MDIQTSLGDIPVRGALDDRPCILCITGMFAPPNEMANFSVAVGPDFAGLVARLPGHGRPMLADTSLNAFAEAFDQLAEQLNVQVVVGLSAGALVALSMVSPRLLATVAVDPPLETAKLWMMTGLLEQTFPEQETFHRNIVGYAPGAFAGRCYLDLLETLTRPTYFVVGDDPLFPARIVEATPSVVDEPTRRLIRAKPWARLRVAPGAGHLIRRDGPATLMATIAEACAEVLPGRAAQSVS